MSKDFTSPNTHSFLATILFSQGHFHNGQTRDRTDMRPVSIQMRLMPPLDQRPQAALEIVTTFSAASCCVHLSALLHSQTDASPYALQASHSQQK